MRRRHALPTYSGTHQRVRAALGPASAQLCVTCEAQAHHWSYDEADPEPMRDVDGSHAGVPYSIDPEHYHPRCRKCHKGLDNALRGKRGSLTLLHHWFVVWRDKLVREGRNEGD